VIDQANAAGQQGEFLDVFRGGGGVLFSGPPQPVE
jgi:hypothetical protein